jgi:hypothetical protein
VQAVLRRSLGTETEGVQEEDEEGEGEGAIGPRALTGQPLVRTVHEMLATGSAVLLDMFKKRFQVRCVAVCFSS